MSVDLFGNSLTDKTPSKRPAFMVRKSEWAGRDLYTTEQNDIERFLASLQRDGIELPSPIWEPAAGLGDVSKVLLRHGYEVRSSDIYAYSDGGIDIEGLDFFACDGPMGCKTIFTNPPFNMQQEFLVHALSMGVEVVFFVRLSFLTGIRRHMIFQKYAPAFVYVYSRRACCYKDGAAGNSQKMIDYCVFMWKPPYRGETKLRWIE